jgi:hypothetical protein
MNIRSLLAIRGVFIVLPAVAALSWTAAGAASIDLRNFSLAKLTIKIYDYDIKAL